MNSDNRLTHAERLRGEIRVNKLFLSGESFIAYPYRIVYAVSKAGENEESPRAALLVSVPKKRFKRAVKRNRLRRCIKEAYRLNKALLHDSLQQLGLRVELAVVYLDKEVQPYNVLEKHMKEMLQKLAAKVAKATDEASNV